MHLVLLGDLHAQIAHHLVVNLAHRRVILQLLGSTLTSAEIMVENHDVIVDVPTFGIGMRSNEIGTIRSHACS